MNDHTVVEWDAAQPDPRRPERRPSANLDADKELSEVRMRVLPQEKGDWMRRARKRGMKLDTWMRRKLNTPDE